MSTQVKSNNSNKWSTTQGSVKPVKLNEIKFVNVPIKSNK